MKSLVYIETTIPSFYVETRSEPEMVARQHWTRQWWSDAFDRYDVVSSEAVLDELARGDYPNKIEAQRLLENLPLLSIDDEIAEIVQAYFQHHLMPQEPTGDALHLAIASFHKCDFLLTWNCRHLANANKFRHIPSE